MSAIPIELPISAQRLCHWFGRGEGKKQAIFDVDLSVLKGSLTILMGPSGSGKTTVLTLLGCLREVQHGNVSLLGTELKGADEEAVIAARRKLGFIFQAHNLHESLTAMQNVSMGLQVHGKGAETVQNNACEHLLSTLGLGDRLNYIPANLSGGQKQRVAIARALVSNPAVVFADEPTAALDAESGLLVVKMLKELGRVRGTTTVMVTHDNRILDMADRIVTLEEGRIVNDTQT